MSRTITVSLDGQESYIVASLAKSKDLTEDQLMKQALRLYQKVENHLNKGDKLLVETECPTSKGFIRKTYIEPLV